MPWAGSDSPRLRADFGRSTAARAVTGHHADRERSWWPTRPVSERLRSLRDAIHPSG